jgi:hypothetical protein
MVGAILNVEFLQTNKGGRQLIWNGYTYSQNNKRDTWVSWKCIDKNCRATMCTRDDVPTKLGNVQTHLPDRAAVEGRKILSANVHTHLPDRAAVEGRKILSANVHTHLPDRAAVEGRKILSAIQFRAKTELKPSPYIYDEEISKLRDAPWDAQSREIAVKLPTVDT